MKFQFSPERRRAGGKPEAFDRGFCLLRADALQPVREGLRNCKDGARVCEPSRPFGSAARPYPAVNPHAADAEKDPDGGCPSENISTAADPAEG